MSLLQDLFITVVNMSITASYAAVGVILVRLLLKKAPKIFSYILWIPVLFRLVCPFSFGSAFSFFNLINLNAKQGIGVSEFVPQNIGLLQTPAIQSGIGSIDSAANTSLPSTIPVASVNPMQIWMTVFSLIWIFGVIALLVYSVVSYAKIKRKLQTATRVDGNVFETDAIGTAFVCGFIRPKIYVPANIGDGNLSYILEHERTHIRRKDYLIKLLTFLALILHWFNPLMWLCFVLMSRDMEMSCDESVLHKLDDSAKGGYSNSLLSLAVKRKGLLAANPLAFGESHVKARIKNVLNYKKPAFWVIIIVVVAVCAAVIAFAANPKDKGTGELEKITDFAWEVINRDIANYESNPEVHIIDSKITRLELLETFDGLADAPIDVYALEYRLLPENLSKVVLAGGMQIDEDGWLKETSSMGSPLLVVSRNSGSAEFIGTLWTVGVKENGGLEPSIKHLLKAKDENAIANS